MELEVAQAIEIPLVDGKEQLRLNRESPNSLAGYDLLLENWV